MLSAIQCYYAGRFCNCRGTIVGVKLGLEASEFSPAVIAALTGAEAGAEAGALGGPVGLILGAAAGAATAYFIHENGATIAHETAQEWNNRTDIP